MKREESVKERGVEKRGEKYTRETGVGEEKRGRTGGEERGEGIKKVEDCGEKWRRDARREGGAGRLGRTGVHAAPLVGGRCQGQGGDGQGCGMGRRGCTGRREARGSLHK